MSKPNRLVVACGDWASSMPDWLLEEVKDERFITVLISLLHDLADHEKVGDAEALLYLKTLSHRVPFTPSAVRIYEYLTRVVLARRNPGMPAISSHAKVIELSEPEQEELNQLKIEIYSKRGDISHPIFKNALSS